jgi:hypothetical protein
MVVMSCTVTVMVLRESRMRESSEVDVTVLVGVADVRLRQPHALETTSQAKYTTAAGAVEHDGLGGEVGEGVGEAEVMGMSDESDGDREGVGIGVLEGLLGEAVALEGATLLDDMLSLDEAVLLENMMSLEEATLLDEIMSLEDAVLLDRATLLDEAMLLGETTLLADAVLLDGVIMLDGLIKLDETTLLKVVPMLRDGVGVAELRYFTDDEDL